MRVSKTADASSVVGAKGGLVEGSLATVLAREVRCTGAGNGIRKEGAHRFDRGEQRPWSLSGLYWR
jgi:hypothetical protein